MCQNFRIEPVLLQKDGQSARLLVVIGDNVLALKHNGQTFAQVRLVEGGQAELMVWDDKAQTVPTATFGIRISE